MYLSTRGILGIIRPAICNVSFGIYAEISFAVKDCDRDVEQRNRGS